jgi:hypothetical protein
MMDESLNIETFTKCGKGLLDFSAKLALHTTSLQQSTLSGTHHSQNLGRSFPAKLTVLQLQCPLMQNT